MLPVPVQGAISKVIEALGEKPELSEALRARWAPGGARGAALPADLAAMLEVLDVELPTLSRSKDDVAALGALFAEPAGELLLTWCAASTWRRDVRLAPLLAIAARHAAFRERVVGVARERVVEGPMLDALACAPLLGDGIQPAMPANAEARARLEILIWEAGASAVESPDLGAWLWSSPETFEVMLRGPARGALRGRVLAARCLEVSVRGMPPATDRAHRPDAPDAPAAPLAPGAARLGARHARARAADGAARADGGHVLDWVSASRRSPSARDDRLRRAPRGALPAAREPARQHHRGAGRGRVGARRGRRRHALPLLRAPGHLGPPRDARPRRRRRRHRRARARAWPRDPLASRYAQGRGRGPIRALREMARAAAPTRSTSRAGGSRSSP